MNHRLLIWTERVQAFSLIGLATTVFLPKGFAWLFFLFVSLCSLILAFVQWASLKKHPMTVPCCAFIAWQLVSALWSDLGDRQYWLGLGYYSLIAFVPIIACTAKTRIALKALRWFGLSAFVYVVILVASLTLETLNLPLIQEAFVSNGNKTIANAVLLGLASGLFLHWSLLGFKEQGVYSITGVVNLVACLVIASFVIWQTQARTALIYLPTACLLVCFFSPFNKLYKAVFCIACLCITLVAMFNSETALSRFRLAAEGMQTSKIEGAVNNSITVRRAMNVHSLNLIEEKPILGHGLGGWAKEWRLRANQHRHADSSTAHNEYLNIPAQLGIPGLFLFLFLLCGMLVVGMEAGPQNRSIIFVFCWMWIWCSAFNALLRDSVFSLPFITLSGLAFCLGTHTTNNDDQSIVANITQTRTPQ